MRAWSRGERIGFFSLVVAVVTCGAVVLSSPNLQALLFGSRGSSEGAVVQPAAALGEREALLDEQRKLLGEQTAAIREELLRVHDERMALWKERMASAASRFDGPPRAYDTVAVRNECRFKVAVAMAYMALDDTWVTRGWWTADAGQTVETDVKTRNGVVYFYAENADEGWTWTGDGRAHFLSLAIVDQRFDHRHGERFVYDNSRTVSFYRRDTGDGWTSHVEAFTCAVEVDEATADPAQGRKVSPPRPGG